MAGESLSALGVNVVLIGWRFVARKDSHGVQDHERSAVSNSMST